MNPIVNIYTLVFLIVVVSALTAVVVSVSVALIEYILKGE